MPATELMSSVVYNLPTVLFSLQGAVLSPAQIIMEKCLVIRCLPGCPLAEILTCQTNESVLFHHLL